MARKIIFKKEHLRKLGNEGEKNWQSRQMLVDDYLGARTKYKKCGYRLYQQKKADGTTQIPDFILTCKCGKKWAIEIGLVGTERVENLEKADFVVVKINRGKKVDFEKKFTCESCPYLG